MILIASPDKEITFAWHQCLSEHYKLYDLDIHDYRTLELCLKKVNFELIIVDLAILGDSGIHEIATIYELQPNAHIVVMTQTPNQREEILAILFGAKAYCSTQMPAELFLKMIKTVLSNELWVDRKFVSRLLLEIEDITKVKHAEANRLSKGVSLMTPREVEIAQWIAQGYSNRKIALQLGISERTVKAHLGVIFRKVGISDRLQLALYMNRHQQLASIWHSNKIDPKLSSSDSNDS